LYLIVVPPYTTTATTRLGAVSGRILKFERNLTVIGEFIY